MKWHRIQFLSAWFHPFSCCSAMMITTPTYSHFIHIISPSNISLRLFLLKNYIMVVWKKIVFMHAVLLWRLSCYPGNNILPWIFYQPSCHTLERKNRSCARSRRISDFFLLLPYSLQGKNEGENFMLHMQVSKF